MGKLFDTLEPLAIQTLNNWRHELDRSNTNLSSIQSLIRSTEDMLSTVNNSLQEAAETSELLEVSDEYIEQSTKALERDDQHWGNIGLELGDLHLNQNLMYASFHEAHVNRTVMEYALKKNIPEEELKTWMQEMNDKVRAEIFLPKTFLENELWKEELDAIEKEMGLNDLIHSEEKETYLDSEKEIKTPTTRPKVKKDTKNQQKQ